MNLSQLKNSSRPKKKIQRVGRGYGSKRGRTSGRGQKGDGARGGYTRRYGCEGGQVPLYRKLPVRGFTRGRFKQPSHFITLEQIDQNFSNGDRVTLAILRERRLIPRRTKVVKLISFGNLTKKVEIEVHACSQAARQKLETASIPFKLLDSHV